MLGRWSVHLTTRAGGLRGHCGLALPSTKQCKGRSSGGSRFAEQAALCSGDVPSGLKGMNSPHADTALGSHSLVSPTPNTHPPQNKENQEDTVVAHLASSLLVVEEGNLLHK